jgi:hypothetical protein
MKEAAHGTGQITAPGTPTSEEQIHRRDHLSKPARKGRDPMKT